MSTSYKTCAIVAAALLALCAGSARGTAAEPANKAWLQDWQKKNPAWRALHLIGPQPQRLGVTKELVADVLAPMGVNVLIIEVNYGFQYKSHPELECRGLSKEQARDLAEFCRKHGIRLIPLFNCLGHQSWAGNAAALLKKYPQFDKTPPKQQQTGRQIAATMRAGMKELKTPADGKPANK